MKDQIAALTQRDLELQGQVGKVDFETGVFAFVADAGLAGTQQDNTAALMQSMGADAYLFGGDNNYPSGEVATLEANWAKFNFAVSDFIAFPALGNHDLDNTGVSETPGSPQTSKFNYLPGNKRYYHKAFAKGSVDLFVLNSGVDSAGDLVEEDGNEVGSTQHSWFVTQLAQSTQRYKVVMFHHPHVTNLNEGVYGQKWLDAMDWPEFDDVDLILCGHAHINELIYRRGVPILNISVGSKPGRELSGSTEPWGTYTLYGATDGAMVKWRGDSTLPENVSGVGWAHVVSEPSVVSKLFFTTEGITLELWRANDSTEFHPLHRQTL